jgi:hypothetical protein
VEVAKGCEVEPDTGEEARPILHPLEAVSKIRIKRVQVLLDIQYRVVYPPNIALDLGGGICRKFTDPP